MRLVSVVLIVVALIGATLPGALRAQESAWVQIEAVPSREQGEARARAYAARLENVHGFQLASGWYAIALGPFDPRFARAELVALRRAGLIPRDSYIAESSAYRDPFWPEGISVAPLAPAEPSATVPTAQGSGESLPPAVPDETPQEARRNERLLSAQERRDLQEAMQWFGHYTAAIDGAFGPGTRRAMASWQSAQGYDPSGILTTLQRQELLAAWREPFDALGLARRRDTDAGIEMLMPTAKVARARVEAPFVQYDPSDEAGMQLLLISQQGDEATLFGLYDIMQTLEIVPVTGPRERLAREFTLRGTSEELSSHTFARLSGGAVKGFTLVWREGDPRVMDAVVAQMQTSFTALEPVLPDTAREGDVPAPSVNLVAGLEIRRPVRTRTGFFVDGRGAVLTTTDVLGGCARLTLGPDQDVDVVIDDAARGLALLRPRARLAPIDVAAFQGTRPQLRSEVAVAGFSYGDVLSLPVMTYGTLADLRGLQGEERVSRLDLTIQPGDAGGPVFDRTGAVLGMVRAGSETGGQRLPQNVAFAVDVVAIAEFLSEAGLSPRAAEGQTVMAPEDLANLAADLAVQVSCWE